MVNVTKDKDRALYRCDECGMKYGSRELAEQCEAWCAKHHTCNLDLIAHAVHEPVDKTKK